MNEFKHYPNYDFIIIGAGPVGLCLTMALAIQQKNVAVFEKKVFFDEHSRAPAIWPRTQEVLSSLNILNPFLQHGEVISNLTLHDADHNPPKPIITFPIEELKYQTNFPHLIILPQNKTERLIYEELQNFKNVSIFFESELSTLNQDDSSVMVTYRNQGTEKKATAKFVIGCDGAHSKVRDLLGFHLEGETYPLKAALADISTDKPSPFPLLTTKEFPAIAIQIESKLWRLILPFSNQDKMPLDIRIEKAVQHLFGEISYVRVWESEFSLHRRLSNGFHKGRVCLAGDAAHLNSPAGGQGMNAGIQDTEFLAQSLLNALEKNSIKPLQSYAKKRSREISQGVNRFTNQFTKVITWSQGKYLKRFFAVLNLLIKIPAIRHRLLMRITMLK